MKTNHKQLLSLLLVFDLVLGLMPSAFAATDAGAQPIADPAPIGGSATEDELR